MARTDAREIYLTGTDKDQLAEVYGGVIEAVQKSALSEKLKNKNYSGDPASGSVEINRFTNSTVQDQGTARQAGAGNKLSNKGKVTVNVNEDKEIVEEFKKVDLRLHGAKGIAELRKKNHIQRMIAYLDREFFNCAETEGTEFTVTGDTIVKKLESLILSVEKTENEFVDGVDRDLIVLTVTPDVYSAVENYINETPNSLTGVTEEIFNKVRIYSNNRQTKDAICMIEEAIAQPVVTDEYDIEKIPLSNDLGLELFFSKGTKAITPDLIKFADILESNESNTDNDGE